MYGLGELKPSITVTDVAVECPVRGCRSHVQRQRGRFVTKPEFLCEEHGIYLSPSTHEYADVRRNFPLIGKADWDLLHHEIATEKRETHRLARERSEDAVTYNVFRSIEQAGRLAELCETFTGREQSAAELVYWSYCLPDGGPLPLLQKARESFRERPARGSEPDLIAVTPTDIIFIEVKLTSGNETTPSRPESLQLYQEAEGGWYDTVFTTDPQSVAVVARKYELMRFWLLGSWMAKHVGKSFTLVSLTRRVQDPNLERVVAPLLRQTDDRRYVHLTWEQIAQFAADEACTGPVFDYLVSKSVGYDGGGTLQPMLDRLH